MAQYRKDLNAFLNQEKTLFETVMLADKFGNIVGGANPTGMAVDAFGRSRTSQPLTLFDSYHRYQDNGRINTANTAGTTVRHDANSSSILCSLGTTSGQYVYRESSRVFAYQPGKSLQILETFVMAPPQAGLRQRYGYFNLSNGVFLEQDGNQTYFVVRNNSTGTVVEERVEKSNWNIDTLDGTNTGSWTETPPTQNRNPSGLTLDLSKAQILFFDIEWLGLGTVRCGFVINGNFIHCHSFHHSNLITGPYMGTACLPVRCEIENTATTGNTSNLRIVCSTVISEGGYEPRGRLKSIGQNVNTSYTMTTAGVRYPVASIRLKSERSDGIVLPKDLAILGISTNPTRLKYEIVSGGSISGGTWVDAGSDSSVQYNITGTSFDGSNSTVLSSGFLSVTNQSAQGVNLGQDVFRYQLERNNFTGSNTLFTLVVSGATNGDAAVSAINWEEPT